MKFPRLLTAEALPNFHLRVCFRDNTETVVDFREQLAAAVMRPLLAEIAAKKTLEEQPRLLGEAIDAHRGGMFQVDDMLVVGGEVMKKKAVLRFRKRRTAHVPRRPSAS